VLDFCPPISEHRNLDRHHPWYLLHNSNCMVVRSKMLCSRSLGGCTSNQTAAASFLVHADLGALTRRVGFEEQFQAHDMKSRSLLPLPPPSTRSNVSTRAACSRQDTHRQCGMCRSLLPLQPLSCRSAANGGFMASDAGRTLRTPHHREGNRIRSLLPLPSPFFKQVKWR